MSLVKHFCPWLELVQVVVGQHTRCQSTAQRIESSGQRLPKTKHKEIVHHTPLQQEVRFKSERRLTDGEFSLVHYHKLQGLKAISVIAVISGLTQKL